jgi:hypothetical protein
MIDVNENILVPTYGGSLYLFDSNGNIIWQYKIGGESRSTPIIDENGRIYHAVQYEGVDTHSYVYAIELVYSTPPTPPTIDGASSGSIETSYDYIFSSTDPDGDMISYMVDWGDETVTDWTELQQSGLDITINHAWNKTGLYVIKAKARDEHGSESEWVTHNVVMPKPKLIDILIDMIGERFPILYRFFELLKTYIIY